MVASGRLPLFSRSRFLVAVTAVASMTVAAVPAGAGLSEPSMVTLNVNSAPTFRGRVTSGDRFCHADRKVVLLARGTDGSFFPLDDDRTNDTGKWQVSTQLDGATTFQAKVKANRAKGLLCEAASSPIRTVG